MPLSCALARDKIFAQEWHSVDKIRFENERMPGNEQRQRQRRQVVRERKERKSVREVTNPIEWWQKPEAKQSQRQTEKARSRRLGLVLSQWVVLGYLAGKDNNFINKYLCVPVSSLGTAFPSLNSTIWL